MYCNKQARRLSLNLCTVSSWLAPDSQPRFLQCTVVPYPVEMNESTVNERQEGYLCFTSPYFPITTPTSNSISQNAFANQRFHPSIIRLTFFFFRSLLSITQPYPKVKRSKQIQKINCLEFVSLVTSRLACSSVTLSDSSKLYLLLPPLVFNLLRAPSSCFPQLHSSQS